MLSLEVQVGWHTRAHLSRVGAARERRSVVKMDFLFIFLQTFT